MAHSSAVNSLAEELVTAVTALDATHRPQAFKHCKHLALRGLKTQQYARTNQFDVQARLDGLVEKFSILNRDDLGESLSVRLKELGQTSYKWIPEILSLFLELSDKPVEKSKLEDLELLKPPDPPPSLTWAEIVADDPLNEKGIWDDIDYGAPSSDDDASVTEDKSFSSETGNTRPSSIDEPDVIITAQSYVVAPDEDALQSIQSAQFWKQHSLGNEGDRSDATSSEKQTLTELQALREVLFALRGLPTSLFTVDEDSEVVLARNEYILSSANASICVYVFEAYTSMSTTLFKLRIWARRKQSQPLLQTFQAATMNVLRDFDKSVSTIEEHVFAPDRAIAVSLLAVYDEIQSIVRPLLQLAKLVTGTPSDAHPFVYLESLFEHTCLAQETGDTGTYELLARIFFECLRTYLRPIRNWMQYGDLEHGDDVFFVTLADRSSSLSSLWHYRYALRLDSQGVLHAPRFLHPAVNKIFNAGKSVVFLKELGRYETRTAEATAPESRLDFTSVCGSEYTTSLAPFSELFNIAFEKWIQSKYSPAFAVLRERLYNECGLWRTLDALEYVYFSRDGSAFQAFADTVFDKLDNPQRGWNDRFLLTELAQSVWGGGACIDSAHLTVRTVRHSGRDIRALAAMVVDYTIPWAVANIIQRSSIPVYSRIFTLLLQVYRAKYLLRQQILQRGTSSRTTTGSKKVLGYIHLHSLSWFVEVLYTYLTETLATSTAHMRTKLAKAEDIDAMADVHETYVKRLQKQCLLSKNLATIHHAIISILDLCVLFSNTLSQQYGQRRPRSSTKRRPLHHQRRRSGVLQAQLQRHESSSDEDEADADDYDADTENASAFEGFHAEKLLKMRQQFHRSCAFVTAGLKGVSRAGNEPAWQMLAEKLDWQAEERLA